MAKRSNMRRHLPILSLFLLLVLGCVSARRATPDPAGEGGAESAAAREIRLHEEGAQSGAATTAMEDWNECRAKAQRLLAAGKPEAARTLLERACALNPDDWESHRELAGLLRERASAPSAVLARDSLLEELDCLVALRPGDEDWRRQRDSWRLAGGGAVEREQALRQRVATAPSSTGPRRRLAAVLLEHPKPSARLEALELLEGLSAAAAEEPRSLELRAEVLWGLGRVNEAEPLWTRLYELSPGRTTLPPRLAEAALSRGQLPLARRWARECGLADAATEAWFMGRILEAAVAACVGREPTYDDKLVLEMALREYERVRESPLTASARKRCGVLEGRLPDAEDRFFNKYDRPRKECYKWLLEP